MADVQETKSIQLVNGGFTLVEEQDYEWASQFRWFRSTGGYAHRQGWKNRKHWTIWLHREVNKTPPHLFTDHVNGNKLDNRRSNLRTVNKAQNSHNRPKVRRTNPSSTFKGVYFNKALGYWCARVQDGPINKITYHRSELDAAHSWNEMARKYIGEFAQFNVLPDGFTPSVKKGRKSIYYGVFPRGKSWVARFNHKYKGLHIGTYSTEIEAAAAYNDVAKSVLGDNARLNKILMPNTEYADDGDDQSQVEDDDQESALLPKSMFPDDVEEGYTCTIKVVGTYEDEVAVIKISESKSDEDEPEEPIEAGLDMLAQ